MNNQMSDAFRWRLVKTKSPSPRTCWPRRSRRKVRALIKIANAKAMYHWMHLRNRLTSHSTRHLPKHHGCRDRQQNNEDDVLEFIRESQQLMHTKKKDIEGSGGKQEDEYEKNSEHESYNQRKQSRQDPRPPIH